MIRWWHERQARLNATRLEAVSLLLGPPAYRIVLAGQPRKARATWRRAVRVYLAQRRMGGAA
jgi:hypothetical protein